MALLRQHALAGARFGILGFLAWGCSEPAPSTPTPSDTVPPNPAPNGAFGGATAGFQGGTSSSGSAAGGSSGAAAAERQGNGGDAPGGAGTDPIGSHSLGEGGASAGAAGLGNGGEAGGTGTAGATSTPPLGPDGYPAECQAQLPSDPAATRETQLQLALQLAGSPFVFGEPNALPQGGTLIPTNLRFYLSQFAFHQGEERVAALPVGADGEPLPYGVALINAEDAASLQLRLRTLPGTYDGVSFLLGISEACNQTLLPLDPPLDEASQLKWPHTLGFLFLRFEGILDDTAAELGAAPEGIHMGAAAGPDGRAPRFRFDVAGASAERLRLDVAVDRVLEAAVSELDLSDFSLPQPVPLDEKILAGERLRRTAVTHEILTLSPEP